MPSQIKASKNLLIRNVPNEDIDWLRESKPVGISQNDYLKSILARARVDLGQDDLFAAVTEPQPIYSSAPFKFIDVFAGIGGFRAGMTSVGGKCVYANEWDRHACKTYSVWYGDRGIDSRDIREVDIPNDIPDHDILCAGFPRQSFAVKTASRRDSVCLPDGAIDEKVGSLFSRVMDIVDCKRPPVLFFEDVKNLKTHNEGKTFKAVERSIRERGYTVSAKVFDACSWVPQRRERTFLVCFDTEVFAHDLNFNFDFPEPPAGEHPTLKSILLSGNPSKRYMLSDKLWTYLQEYAKKHRAKGNGFGYGLFSGEDVAKAISARYCKDGSEILINQKGWRNPRRLLPREVMLLMGFEDEYAELFGHKNGFPQVVSDTQSYRQFGNAVVRKIIGAVGAKIVHTISRAVQFSDHACLLKGRLIAGANLAGRN